MQEKRKYNVLLVTASLGVGGLERYLLNVLKTLDRNIFIPSVVYNGLGDGIFRKNIEDMGIEVIRYEPNDWKNHAEIDEFIRKLCTCNRKYASPTPKISFEEEVTI